MLSAEETKAYVKTWLRKLVSDIWGDKDKYREWQQSNSSNFTSGKKKFTPEVDRINNLAGGLDAELIKQLKIYTDCKRRGVPVDDAVQPHMYEEVLHFAIRMGKMSMEAKFFYLVQGIACGLLPAERMRVLAGEEGDGLLNIFPFIDYFYSKNNSLAEIKALADRLRETNDPTKE